MHHCAETTNRYVILVSRRLPEGRHVLQGILGQLSWAISSSMPMFCLAHQFHPNNLSKSDIVSEQPTKGRAGTVPSQCSYDMLNMSRCWLAPPVYMHRSILVGVLVVRLKVIPSMRSSYVQHMFNLSSAWVSPVYVQNSYMPINSNPEFSTCRR